VISPKKLVIWIFWVTTVPLGLVVFLYSAGMTGFGVGTAAHGLAATYAWWVGWTVLGWVLALVWASMA
jgi:hypothetical protein